MADDQTPNVSDGIVKARAAGYSDDDIANHLAETLPGIKKARDAGYSNAEILSHLAGGSSAAPEQPAQTDETVASDVAKSLPTGVAKGTLGLVGAIPAISGAMHNAANKYLFDPLFNAISGPPKAIPDGQGPVDINAAASPDALQTQVEKVTGEFHKPQTTAGKYAETVGEFVPNIVGGPEGLASRVLTRAVAPGVASEAAGQATEGTAAEPYARMAGAVAGGALASRLAAARAATPQVPLRTADDLKAAARADYQSPDVKDLRVTPQSVNNLGSSIENDLLQQGFRAHNNAPVFNVVREIQQARGPVAVDDLDSMRKALGQVAKETDNIGRPTPNAAAATHSIGRINDYMANDMAHPQNVLQGNPQAAQAALSRANANYGAGSRSQAVSRLLDNAEIDAGVANSGMNVQNRIRQTFKPMLKNGEAKMAGYNDEERAGMNRLVRGATAMNALRYAGNAMGGSGMTVGPYVLFGHPLVPAAGWALKRAANALTTRQAQNLSQQLLQRAPAQQQVFASNRAIRYLNGREARAATGQGALRAAAAGLLSRTLNR